MNDIPSNTIGKATAVVLRGVGRRVEVLVFDHPLDDGGLIVLLPAGTLELGEAPEAAAIRELREETGLEAAIRSLCGVLDEFVDGEARRRWVYLFDAPEGIADEWLSTCDCGSTSRCHWLPLNSAEVEATQQPWLDLARSALGA